MKTALLTIAALAASCASTTPAVLGPNRSFVLRVEGNESIPAAELARAVSFELDEYEEGDFDGPEFDEEEFEDDEFDEDDDDFDDDYDDDEEPDRD